LKLNVVESFPAGHGGAKLLAFRWSVLEEKVRTWDSRYRLHGVAVLQPTRGAYTVASKLEVLKHRL
jgi:transposase